MEADAGLTRKLLAITEPRQQRVLISEHFEHHSAHDLVGQLEALIEAVVRGGARAAWLPFIFALNDGDIDQAKVEEVYRAAAEAETDLVRGLLIGFDAVWREAGAGEFRPDSLIDDLTLGERKAKARGQEPNVLERLLFDPDPGVVRILLGNPRTTEPWVVRLAAYRPNRGLVLREIGRAPKWVASPRVREALVFNPYTPARLSIGLTPLLNTSSLRQVGLDGNLHPAVQRFARSILHVRRPEPRTDPAVLDIHRSSEDLLDMLGIDLPPTPPQEDSVDQV